MGFEQYTIMNFYSRSNLNLTYVTFGLDPVTFDLDPVTFCLDPVTFDYLSHILKTLCVKSLKIRFLTA